MRRQLFAYDTALKSLNPDAPAIDPSLKPANRKGEIARRAWTGRPIMKLPVRPHHGPGPEPGQKPGPEPRHEPGQGPDHAPGPRPGQEPLPPSTRPSPPVDDKDDGEDGPPDDLRVGEILIPMPWRTGPCANILVRYEEPPDTAGPAGFTPPTIVWVLPVVVMILTVLAAAGPVVRRTRRLTRQVRASAADRYRMPIPFGGSDEIGQLARAFEEAREEILAQVAQQEEREQNLRAFVENTTHDISIPLTVLQGHLTDMARAAESGTPTEAEVVAAAATEAQYMAALIGNLSVASRIENGEPTMQQVPIDIGEIVRRCVSRHRPIARQLGVALEHAIPEAPVVVRGDMTFIEQAFNNVIFNAIRYNNRDGHVAVILETAGDGARAGMSVIDDGPGIPEEEMAKLVERYYRRGKERGRGVDNQGIGLNIASRIAAMHGWEFELSKSDFGGLKVCFRFPIDKRTA
jgi:signal transduction histidine kinase